jgi:uncharacterized RDD family membrane protein YckC
MKCPKCGYLGFEPSDRCRNCGYDFAFTPPQTTPELPIRPVEAEGLPPFDDLVLSNNGEPGLRPDLRRGPSEDLGRRKSPESGRDHASDLPLFAPGEIDDVPLITRASPPRQPLSVRRATPEMSRPRTEPRASSAATPMLDLEPSETASESRQRPQPRPYRSSNTVDSRREPSLPEAAGVLARALAVAVDLFVLAVTDLAVIYFTLQICGLTTANLDLLPKGPLIAFLVVQNGGYLIAFTAGGQTLGKMLAGIRVVSTHPGGSVDLGHSVVRTMVWALLAIPAGLGFVTALFNRDRRGLHDRCAGTRVVRATA